ncbi:MAG: hypothetical protein IPK44_25375 [Candidatus Accumulibacter sp.]|uniref:hypothetical protein n=1 Tax=Accumulibacter sp. TaxID=2053492 RepID=UPI00258F8E37|nr:hypothetical protein [Accumulibacter sp.]MBK8117620.1 hypothetical protein [Accumulibacter sp.]
MEIFPADCFDCDALLTSLAGTGMIERYEVGGKRYLHVVNFTKHQNPHRDEKASTIPAPGSNGVRSEQAPCEHHANTVQALCEHHANTVAIGLIPDSLIPDSLIPESKTGAAGHPGDLARPEKPAAVAAVRFDAAGFLVEQGSGSANRGRLPDAAEGEESGADTHGAALRRCRGCESGDAGSGRADDMLRKGMGGIQGRVGWPTGQGGAIKPSEVRPSSSRQPQPDAPH